MNRWIEIKICCCQLPRRLLISAAVAAAPRPAPRSKKRVDSLSGIFVAFGCRLKVAPARNQDRGHLSGIHRYHPGSWYRAAYFDFCSSVVVFCPTLKAYEAQTQTQATKDELFEIAGAFAKLASDPRIPSAASVYEEAEATLGNAAWARFRLDSAR